VILAVLAGLLGNSTADAGWLTVKNDTKQTLVIQELGGTPQRPARGRCIRLAPGESYREFVALPGEKVILVFDSTNLERPLGQDKLAWKNDDLTYKLLTDGNGVRLLIAPTILPKR
jgi:hypothetical protein